MKPPKPKQPITVDSPEDNDYQPNDPNEPVTSKEENLKELKRKLTQKRRNCQNGNHDWQTHYKYLIKEIGYISVQECSQCKKRRKVDPTGKLVKE